jgi:cytochrome b561
MMYLYLYHISFLSQFVVGFFSFLILLCCEGATAAFRASLVPIHATFGITTFMLAVATCLTGLTEKAFFELGYVIIQCALDFSIW